MSTADTMIECLEFAETATEHYLIAALWTEEKDDVNPKDLPQETWDAARKDCRLFVNINWHTIQESGMDAEHVGHNFWLTRNGHGTGFWDRDLGEVGDRLSEACNEFGETWIYTGDDGLVYLM